MIKQYQIHCLYCDNKWLEHILKLRELKCAICKETKNIKAKEMNEDKVDYYKGDDPFPEKKSIVNDYVDENNSGDWPFYN